MKKLFIISFCIVLFLSGCGGSGNHHADQSKIFIAGSSQSQTDKRDYNEVFAIKDHYYFYCPIMDGVYEQMLTIEDENGQIIKDDNAAWELSDVNCGTITSLIPSQLYVKVFTPSKPGEFTMSATSGDKTTTAQITVYKRTLLSYGDGFDLSSQSVVDKNSPLADLVLLDNGSGFNFKNEFGKIPNMYGPNSEFLSNVQITDSQMQEAGFDGDREILAGGWRYYIVKSNEGNLYVVILSLKDIIVRQIS